MLKEASGIKKIILRCGRTDLRKGIDGLKSIISLHYGLDPMEEGTLFLFCGTRTDRFKGLLWEGDGFVLIYKRLSFDGRFQWPRDSAEARDITPEQYRLLMSGFTLEGTVRRGPKTGKSGRKHK